MRYSEHRAGFEIRPRWRCKQITTRTRASVDRLVRSYELTYVDERPKQRPLLPPSGASLLSSVIVTGHDDNETQSLPAIELYYSTFDPNRRNFFPLSGTDLPAPLANEDAGLVDFFGQGLPDILQMNGTVRYWRNLGRSFDLPCSMREAPGGRLRAWSARRAFDRRRW